MPILKISSSSVVYGSADAGKTVESSADIESILKTAAEEFFLIGHIVKDKLLFCAGDIEVHQRSSDDGYYMLDLARAFPPQCPQTSTEYLPGLSASSGSMFFRLLRPELLQILKKNSELLGLSGLSSDSFSGWGKVDMEIHNKNATLATKYLYDSVCSSIARHLQQVVIGNVLEWISRIGGIVHQQGGNIRLWD
jgi:hypothetical protein